MTTLAHEAAPDKPRGGGVAAGRALVRWAERMFRREWKQQLLVLTLLTVAVAAAIVSITIAHNTISADNSEFGSANQVVSFDGSDPQKLQAGIDSARRSFGTIDVIGHRYVHVPGSVETVDYRSRVQGGAYSSELLALRRGRYPVGPREAAVTNGVATSLRLDIGSTLALDGHPRTVVGIVENPRRLSDEFALVSPASEQPDEVDVLVQASEGSMTSFYDAMPDERSHTAFAGSMTRGNDVASAGKTLAKVSVATVFLLLASLVAAAGFAVVAQRRLRHLGVLAAVGATQRQVRLVLLANGALVGAIAAIVGTGAGLALWVAFAPTLETAVGHRIDRLSLPWDLIAVAGILALVGASAAAVWPVRAIARPPARAALSRRPPGPRPARHSAIAAAALIAAGTGCLALSNRDRPALIAAGLLGTIVGSLLLGPLAIRTFSGVAGRVSIAPRLALRDIARYQARSGAALAAVMLALGIAATVVVTASAEEAKKSSEPPGLSDRQVRIYLGPAEARELTSVDAVAQIRRLSASTHQLAARLGGATSTPLSRAVEPGAPPMVIGGTRVFPTLELTRPSNTADGIRYSGVSQLYVATPAVLRYLGIEPATIAPGTDFLVDRSVEAKTLFVPSVTTSKVSAVTNVQKIDVGRHLFGGDSGSRPASFVTVGGLRRHDWRQIPAGWLVEANRPLTSDQIAEARTVAADAGLTIEARRKSDQPTEVMAIATAAGALFALAILAMTVGLIRGESAGDLRTLTAAGATAQIRRTLTATTAGALALLGALLGIAGAYVALVALYHDDLGYLRDVPVVYLVLAVVGVPLCAAAAGWLVAGREPPVTARPVIE